jgi:hypothetical protein
MTKLWALKQLYVSLGGDFKDVRLIETNAEMIKYISDYIKEHGGGGGGTIAVDDELSETSKNPVQNKVITNAISEMPSVADVEDIINANAATIIDLSKAITELIDL